IALGARHPLQPKPFKEAEVLLRRIPIGEQDEFDRQSAPHQPPDQHARQLVLGAIAHARGEAYAPFGGRFARAAAALARAFFLTRRRAWPALFPLAARFARRVFLPDGEQQRDDQASVRPDDKDQTLPETVAP